MNMGYRSEELYGEGYRSAREVIAHEIFQLGNTDILDTLSSTIFKGSEYGKELQRISADMTSCTESEFLDEAFKCDSVAQEFVDEMLDRIKDSTGEDVRYVLWLCNDPKEIIHAYQLPGDVLIEFDKYDEGNIILSDIKDEGKLYGYETLPQKICTVDKDCNEI